MHAGELDAAPDDPVPGLAGLVVKDGVGLGSLTEAQRALVLGFVWAGLPRDAMTEKALNEVLKAQLAGAVRCLDTDHVELRRWLCDTGWLHRDGYGREYRRVAPADLPSASQALGGALSRAFDGGDTARWAEGRRVAREAEREARRRAFQARSVGPAAP